jgi:hypothetical protein
MVIRQFLSKKHLLDLAGKSDEKDKYVMSRLAISGRDLAEIRSQGTVFDRSRVAARWIYFLTGNSSYVTQFNLAAMISKDWENPEVASRVVNNAIRKEYRKFVNNYAPIQLYPSSIELFRCDIIGKKTSFLKEREKWEKFSPSNDDWLRSVTIPVKIGQREGELLGVYWLDGHLRIDKGRSFHLFLEGGRKNFDFYRKELEGRIKEAHNIEVNTKEVEMVGSTYPFLIINSKAVVTHLRDDLNYPLNKKDFDLPPLESKEAKEGFLYGAIAARGRLTTQNVIFLYSYNFSLAYLLKLLAEEVGYKPKFYFYDRLGMDGFYRTQYITYFSASQVRRMSLINPAHQIK